MKTPIELSQSITGFSFHASCSYLSIFAMQTGRSSAAHRTYTSSAPCESTRAGEYWRTSRTLMTSRSLNSDQTLRAWWSYDARSAGVTDRPSRACCSYRPTTCRITYTQRTLQISTILMSVVIRTFVICFLYGGVNKICAQWLIPEGI